MLHIISTEPFKDLAILLSSSEGCSKLKLTRSSGPSPHLGALLHFLDDRSTTFDIELSSSTTHYTFGAKQYFTGKLASSVNNRKSCYLKPLSRYFATFDSFLYQPEIPLSGCQSLIGFQVTTTYEHRISVVGLKELQACLNAKVPALKALRPTSAEKLILLFVVPEPMAASFRKMEFKGKAAHWGQKIAQFVLELPEPEVVRSY